MRTAQNGQALMAHALEYAKRGWTVIPVKDKKPACKWQGFQHRRPTNAELRELFRRPGVTGLAVVLGPVSGGIACRDYDDLTAYEAWAATHPALAMRLPTVRTARGRHVYFRGPEGFKKFPDGEYRATSGQYCLLPPSQHPDGARYEWVIQLPDGKLPMVDPVKHGLVSMRRNHQKRDQQEVGSPVKTSQRDEHARTKLEVTQRTQTTQEIAGGTGGAVSSALSVLPPIEVAGEVETAINTTLPKGPGQRHRQVFELCRHLRAIPMLQAIDPQALRPVVKDWHRRALPAIGTKPFSETWADFLNAWPRVKYAIGDGPVDRAYRRAMKKKPPRRALELYEPDDPIVSLAALCRELQGRKEDGEFFALDCRTAGRLLELSHKSAWKLLMLLVKDGFLIAGEKGSQAKRRASEFMWVDGVPGASKQGATS